MTRSSSVTSLAERRPAVLWVVAAIVLAVVIRIVLLPSDGFPDDVSAFEAWALALGTTGTHGFFADTSGVRYPALDYPPGYMYVLLAIGYVYVHVLHLSEFTLVLKVLEKLPATLADFGVAFFAYALAAMITTVRNARIVLVTLLLAPPLWLVSAYWGQVDSVAVLVLLATLWAALKERWILMWALFACTILIKPQAAPIAPLLLIWEWRRAGLTLALPVGWSVAAVLAYLSTLPFTTDHGVVASARWLLERYTNGISKYPNNTTGGFTLFGITGQYFQSDAQRVFGIPLHTWGIALFVALLVAVAAKFASPARNAPTRADLLAAVFIVLAGFFMLSTRMHERYFMPAVVVGAIVACINTRYALTAIVFGCTFTVNCVFILRGFYGGGHHPATLVVAHALSAVNLGAFILAAGTFFTARPAETAAPRAVPSAARAPSEVIPA